MADVWDNEMVLRQAGVDLSVGMATIVGRERVIVPRDLGKSKRAAELRFIFQDRFFAYAELSGDTREPVPVIRDIGDKEAATTLLANPDGPILVAEGRFIWPQRNLHEYVLRTSSLVARGAPVVVDGLLAGMVIQQETPDIHVLPIGVALDRIEFELLDRAAQTVIRHAEGLRRAAGEAAIHMEFLVLALAAVDDAFSARLRGRNRDYQAVAELLGTPQKPLPGSSKYTAANINTIPPLSKHARTALDNARRLSGNEPTSTADLASAMFSLEECSIIKQLLAAGISLKARAPRVSPIAGYASDAPTADTDPFDVHRHANALCSVLAAKTVSPPVSVGLFAPWGAGKSSFMMAMSKRFDRLTATARANPDSVFCTNIVQIWFNAWHYAEQNLLASLADTIFEGLDAAIVLANAEPETVDGAALDRRVLEQKQKVSEDKATEAKKELAEACRRVGEIDRQIEIIKTNDRAVDAKFTPREVAAAVASNEAEAQKYTEKAADALKVSTGEAEALVKSVSDFWSAAHALRTSKQWQRSGSLWLLAGIVFAVIPLFINGLLSFAASIPIGAIISLTATVLAPLTKAMRALEKARKRAADAIEEKRRALLAQHAEEKKKAEETQVAAQDKIDVAARESAQIQRDIASLSPERSMAEWVRERHASRTYAQQLGVAAEAHRDFRRLTALLKKVAEGKPETDPEIRNIKRIDRIVLYIDDLDRCPEGKVVEVLRAVHLLLAFELFVVIVAVDSKWLLHSLSGYSKAFRDGGEWRSTPLSYLEKIIQIPFVLDAMTPEGYGHFIDGLTGASHSGAQSEPKQQPSPPSPRPQDQQPEPTALPLPTSQPLENQPATATTETTAPAAIDPNPDQLTFTTGETTFMKSLHPLMSSPRNAKRFVNIYRLIRATMSAEELDSLVDPERKAYEQLLVLVATVTNYPEAAGALIRKFETPKSTLQLELPELLKNALAPFLAVNGTLGKIGPWIPTVSRYLIRTP
ncbi:MAG TPA: P-loop NTPase fold protein [Thermoanaerobaculia bacterium]|nr:P-loop NTPase fold protein [Thermoanaerobaculia bacterium]